MTYDLQFVDAITSSPTVRLNLMAGPWNVRETTEFGMPELRRASVSTLLADGERYPAAAYGNRLITLVVQILNASDDDTATALQQLMRELNRPSNILRYRPGTTEPVHFRTFRCGPSSVMWDPVLKQVTASIPAEPFALGLKETLPAVTVSNDPAELSTPVVSDTFTRTVAGGLGTADTGQAWTIRAGSAAQFSANGSTGRVAINAVNTIFSATLAGSLDDYSVEVLLSIDRLAAGNDIDIELLGGWQDTSNYYAYRLTIPTTNLIDLRFSRVVAGAFTTTTATSGITHVAGQQLVVTFERISGRHRMTLRRASDPASTSWAIDTVDTTHGAGLLGIRHVLVTGNTSTLPVTVTHDNLVVTTPALWTPTTSGRACFDITDVKGDVETPLVLNRPKTECGKESLFAVRRRGNPANVPFLAHAESMTQLNSTTVQPNSATFSGAGNNYSRCTFATGSGYLPRVTLNAWPPSPSVDARGTYRVFARLRKNANSGTVQVRLSYGVLLNGVSLDAVTVPWTGTQPVMVDLGKMSMPMGEDPVHDGYSGVELSVHGTEVGLEAQRISGADTLDIDYLMFVPADDRLCIVHWPTSGAERNVLDGTHDLAYSVVASTGAMTSPMPGYHVGGLPMVSPGVTNRIFHINEVKSGEGDAAFLTTSWSFEMWYWPRYLSVRPVAS